MSGRAMSRYKELYRVDGLPVMQNRMYDSEREARNSRKGDVDLVQDLESGLIFNRAFQPDALQYDLDYQNEQALSGVFQAHLKSVAAVIQCHFRGQSLLEVGCGKGHFLEQLQQMGFAIMGLDPTYEGSSSSVIKAFYGPEVGVRADGIVLRHVLEHIQNPVRFLQGIRDVNGGGKIYIEVPCFDWICDHRSWFDIFYEHVNYFRLDDFHRMFGLVYEAGHTFGGQYLYAVADLATLTEPTIKDSAPFQFPPDFLDPVARWAKHLRARPTTLWGGASKGVIFSLFMEKAGVKIDTVIDINPAKQGRYLAATGIRVQSPAEALDRLGPRTDLFIMNDNYLEEIRRLTRDQYTYITFESGPVQRGGSMPSV